MQTPSGVSTITGSQSKNQRWGLRKKRVPSIYIKERIRWVAYAPPFILTGMTKVASWFAVQMCHAKSQFGLITQIGVTRVLYHP